MLDNWLKKYAEKFDDGFPMMPLGWGRTEEEIIELIKNCISNNKNAYEIGFVKEDDVEY